MALNAKQPEVFYFKDDGRIPNNRLPLLLYRNALSNGVNAQRPSKTICGKQLDEFVG